MESEVRSHSNPRRTPAALALALLLVLLLPAPAWADAPITRGPDSLPQGSMGSAAAAGSVGTTSGTSPWRGVQMLPPLTLPARQSAMFPQGQAGGDPGSAIAWLGRQLNPGNWILDAGMGILAGVVKTLTGLAQKSAATLISGVPVNLNPQATNFNAGAPQPLDAGWSVVPGGCFDSATNIVFCVPTNLTYAHPGIQTVWGVLRSVAAGLITILFVVRIGRLIAEGPRSLAAEGKSLLLTFVLAMTFVQATQPICALIIDFFNGLNSLLLRNASLALPAVDVGDLNIGSNLMFLLFWVLILVLTLKSFLRLARVIVLLAVAPLAGALLLDRATSGRFGAWFGKLIEALLEQTSLVIVFVVAAAIVQPYQGRSGGDAFVQLLLAIVVLLMALGGPSLIGLAAGGAGGSFVTSLVSYAALRRIGGRALARGGGGGRAAARASDAPRATDRAAVQASSADPSSSAAAQRQAASGSRGERGGRSAAPVGAFRLADGESLRVDRARSRYQAAVAAPRDDDGRRSLAGRREQALMRGTLMRQRADALRAQGDSAGAGVLARKAQLQTRFGRGEDISRAPRFTPAQRATCARSYREALAEVQGLHALERDTLTQQIAADAARLPELRRRLGVAGVTDDAGALHSEHQAVEQRLAANRARLHTLTPSQGGTYARATREAATALANERLPHELRSTRYAERHRADRGSAFARRISGAPTQRSRDELARARATGARAARTPPGASQGAGRRRALSASRAGAGALRRSRAPAMLSRLHARRGERALPPQLRDDGEGEA